MDVKKATRPRKLQHHEPSLGVGIILLSVPLYHDTRMTSITLFQVLRPPIESPVLDCIHKLGRRYLDL